MEEAYETLTHAGLTVKIYQDTDSRDSPREWYDNFGTMACFHREHILGDTHDFAKPDDLHLHLKETGSLYLPLYLYDHSGITMRTGPFNCPWDSGQVGYIYIEPQQVREEYGVKRIGKKVKAKALSMLETEVKVYDQWLTGDIWGYFIENDEGDDLDSCWGFYGSDEVEAAAKEAAEPRSLPRVTSGSAKRGLRLA